jgi:hypothetical protein
MKKLLLVFLAAGLLIGLGGCGFVLGLVGIGNLSVGPNPIVHDDAGGFIDGVTFTIVNEYVSDEQVWFSLIWRGKDVATAEDEVFYLGEVNTVENDSVEVTVTRAQFNEWMDNQTAGPGWTIDYGDIVVELDPDQLIRELKTRDNRSQLGASVLVSLDNTEQYVSARELIIDEVQTLSFYPAGDVDEFTLACEDGVNYEILTNGIAGSHGVENDVELYDTLGNPMDPVDTVVDPATEYWYGKNGDLYARIKFTATATGSYSITVHATDPEALSGYYLWYELPVIE